MKKTIYCTNGTIVKLEGTKNEIDYILEQFPFSFGKKPNKPKRKVRHA